MGIIKDNNYSDEEMEIARLFNAVSHPARKRILDLLQHKLFIRNIDLCQILNLSPTAVMNHLNTLKNARVIDVEYSIHYHEIKLIPEQLKKISNYLERFYEN